MSVPLHVRVFFTEPPEDPQPSFDNCQKIKKTGTDEKFVMIGNSIRICPYLMYQNRIYSVTKRIFPHAFVADRYCFICIVSFGYCIVAVQLCYVITVDRLLNESPMRPMLANMRVLSMRSFRMKYGLLRRR